MIDSWYATLIIEDISSADHLCACAARACLTEIISKRILDGFEHGNAQRAQVMSSYGKMHVFQVCEAKTFFRLSSNLWGCVVSLHVCAPVNRTCMFPFDVQGNSLSNRRFQEVKNDLLHWTPLGKGDFCSQGVCWSWGDFLHGLLSRRPISGTGISNGGFSSSLKQRLLLTVTEYWNTFQKTFFFPSQGHLTAERTKTAEEDLGRGASWPRVLPPFCSLYLFRISYIFLLFI